MRRTQQGYFLILAVILIMVLGVMGTMVAYTYAQRAQLSVAQQKGLQTYYIAESGLEVATRLLIGPNLVSGQGLTCATLTGSPLLTNATMLEGTFTATAVGGGLYSATTSLTVPITATSNSLTVASTTGMAAHGRVRIDSEAIDYSSISGNSLVGLNRGIAGTTAAPHAAGAIVTESVCLINVQAGIPSIASPQYKRELEVGVEIITTSDMWAVGSNHSNLFSIIRWNYPKADVWNDAAPPGEQAARADLFGVSFSSPTNGWAVGAENNLNFTMGRWTGSLPWAVTPVAGACNKQDLLGVKVTSASEAWAVGLQYRPGCTNAGNYRYTILRWNGATWSLLTPSSNPAIPADSLYNGNLNAIDTLDTNGDGLADIGFAVGNGGAILQYDGVSWRAVGSGTIDNLYGINIISSSEAWAVGANGRILKWDGTNWNNIWSPTLNDLSAISMVGSTAGWAVGKNGTILYYNGNGWAIQSSFVSKSLFGVVALSNASAYIVGSSNTLLRWSGTAWVTATPPTNYSVDYFGITSMPGMVAGTGSQAGSWQQNSL